MLMSEERRRAKRDRFVYLMTPGWFLERGILFGHWDTGKNNKAFPQHDAAVIVDAPGVFLTA